MAVKKKMKDAPENVRPLKRQQRDYVKRQQSSDTSDRFSVDRSAVKQFRQDTCDRVNVESSAFLNRTFVLEHCPKNYSPTNESFDEVLDSSHEDDSDTSITSGPSIRDVQVTMLPVNSYSCPPCVVHNGAISIIFIRIYWL